MFCALSLYFYIESSPSMHFVYLSDLLWFLLSPKKIHICALVLPHIFLLFFLRFRLMLGTASLWVGSEFSRLWSCFPRRWLTIDSPLSSWFSRYGFWWFDFYSSRTAPWFDYFVLSTLPSMFPLLIAAFIVACVSLTLPFAMFSTPGSDSVLLRVRFVDLEDCFWSQVWALVSRGLASVLPHSGCSLLFLLPLV